MSEKSPINIKKIGHIVYTCSDLERTSKFWTEIMGFKFSDKNEMRHGVFPQRHGSSHHRLDASDGKNHCPSAAKWASITWRFEVASVSELFKIRDFLKSKGVTIFYEGRRGPGGNPGVEFYDPDGYKIEIYAAMDQIGTDGKSRPANEWSRATTLEEAVNNPLPGAEYH